MANFIIKPGNVYSKVYNNKDTGFSVGYFTPKEIKNLFPNGVRVDGQIGYGKDEIGTLSDGTPEAAEETVYKVTTSSVRYRTVGYIELESDRFIAVKKDAILLLILYIILGLLLLAGLIVGITYAVRANSDEANGGVPGTTSPGQLDSDQLEGLGELDLPSKADIKNKQITITGITEMHMKANQRQQNVILTNSDKNEGVCFMTFTIYIDNDKDKVIDPEDQMIYKSGLVQPGYSISKFSINQDLAAGEYQVIVMEQPYSYDQARTKLNNMIVAAKLIVE